MAGDDRLRVEISVTNKLVCPRCGQLRSIYEAGLDRHTLCPADDSAEANDETIP